MALRDNATLEEYLDKLLSEPVAAAQERARTAFDKVAESCDNQFVLIGAGNMGRRILARLRQDGIEPIVFTDNQSTQWGKTIDGIEVVPPEEAAAHYGRTAVFIVTIYNCRHSFPDTRDQFLALGCEQVISVIPVRWKYCESFLPYYRDDLPEKVLTQADHVREAFALFCDEPSRREFVAQVAWRLHGDFDVLGRPEPDEYFPRDVVRLTADEFFVDVGAYDGDTVRQFLRRRGSEFRRVIALEPDTQNFDKLVKYVTGLPVQLASKIQPHALAASNRACRLRFSEGEGTSSAINGQGSTEVECIRLDDLLDGQRPTYIKMDIEGAELDAIEGCRRLLVDVCPMLAVCVYHAQDHLWKIPIAVHQIHPHYAFYLRSHMPECWETVCYAVPPDRI